MQWSDHHYDESLPIYEHYKKRSTATAALSELASKKFQQSTDPERAFPAQHQAVILSA
jgi:hypothetical protein